MFYIHQISCISPQQTFSEADLDILHESVEYKMIIKEPAYEKIPPGIIRRMGKAVRIGVGAALPLMKNDPDGIIIGTANGGIEDCVKFLNQIVKYDEGTLTPGDFVQSTPNAIAAQLALLNSNKGYNMTHVHSGLAFENAIIDADMMLGENPENSYLLGAVDEISNFNYNIDRLAGWYKQEDFKNTDLYRSNSPGSIAGEGAAMFIINNSKEKAKAKLQAVLTLNSIDETVLKEQMKNFLQKNLSGEIDLFLSGENGDTRFSKYYNTCESVVENKTTLARFKHMSGEYATSSGTALWLACHILETQKIPEHMIKRSVESKQINNILIYNCFKGEQHSFILVSKA